MTIRTINFTKESKEVQEARMAAIVSVVKKSSEGYELSCLIEVIL